MSCVLVWRQRLNLQTTIEQVMASTWERFLSKFNILLQFGELCNILLNYGINCQNLKSQEKTCHFSKSSEDKSAKTILLEIDQYYRLHLSYYFNRQFCGWIHISLVRVRYLKLWGIVHWYGKCHADGTRFFRDVTCIKWKALHEHENDNKKM